MNEKQIEPQNEKDLCENCLSLDSNSTTEGIETVTRDGKEFIVCKECFNKYYCPQELNSLILDEKGFVSLLEFGTNIYFRDLVEIFSELFVKFINEQKNEAEMYFFIRPRYYREGISGCEDFRYHIFTKWNDYGDWKKNLSTFDFHISMEEKINQGMEDTHILALAIAIYAIKSGIKGNRKTSWFELKKSTLLDFYSDIVVKMYNDDSIIEKKEFLDEESLLDK